MVKTELHKLFFVPSKGQSEKLQRAVRNNTPTSIRVGASQLSQSGFHILVPRTVLSRVSKNAGEGRGSVVKITSPRKRIPGQEGGFSLGSVGRLAAPYAGRAMASAPGLAKGALTNFASGIVSALGGQLINKLFGKGGKPNIGGMASEMSQFGSKEFLNPILRDLFSQRAPLVQKKALAGVLSQLSPKILDDALRGSGQTGGIGALAAIGIPMALQLAGPLLGKLFGGGQKGGLLPLPLLGLAIPALAKLFGGSGKPKVSNILPLLENIGDSKKVKSEGIRMLFGENDPLNLKGEMVKVLRMFPKGSSSEIAKALGISKRDLRGGAIGALAAIGIPLAMQLLGPLLGGGQRGGFIQLIIPELIKAFTGGKSGGFLRHFMPDVVKAMRQRSGGLVNPYQRPPPFIGSWQDYGYPYGGGKKKN